MSILYFLYIPSYTSILILINILHIPYMYSVYRHYPQILLRGASVVWVRRSPPIHASAKQHIQRLPHHPHLHTDLTDLTSKVTNKPSHYSPSAPTASSSVSFSSAAYTCNNEYTYSSSSSSSSNVKQS